MAGVVVSLAVCLLGLLVVYRCLAAWGLRAPGSLARHAVEEGPPAAQGLQPGWKIFLLGAGSRVGLLLAGMAAAMLLSDGALTWEGAPEDIRFQAGETDAARWVPLADWEAVAGTEGTLCPARKEEYKQELYRRIALYLQGQREFS